MSDEAKDSFDSCAVHDLDTPCFLVDIDKVDRNTERMRATCERLKLQLRAHTKTHKTLKGALLQTDGSKKCIAVSTLAEAEFYASHGFDDILLAVPITESKIPRCLKLIERLEEFHVFVSGPDNLEDLTTCEKLLPEGKFWSVVLEVDAGYGRTGFDVEGSEIIEAAKKVVESPKMRLESIYCHCGNLYDAKSGKERVEQQSQTLKAFASLKESLMSCPWFRDYVNCPYFKFKTGTGSTPTCSLPLDSNNAFDEFHPGAYVFYDYEQYLLNACTQSDIACRVMTRVVAHKPELHTIIVDCGFTALSHDGMRQRLPQSDFCLIQGEANLKLTGMSQELGKIVAKEGDLDCSKYPIGTVLFIYPYHACAAAANHQTFYVHSGDKVIETWKPVRGW